jgi:MFS family permease
MLLVGVNALVGGMVGQERTVLPLLAKRTFGLTALSAVLTFLVAFGLVKAVTNLLAGAWADRAGRKPVLIAGWFAGLPVPALLIWAPSWAWVVVANVLLGVNQGLAWSMTVTMKVDLVGPRKRGLAMGFNEAAGYGAVAVTAALTGYIAARSGLRPEPFYLGLAYAGLGLGVSAIFVHETLPFAHREGETVAGADRPMREVFALTSFRERALSSCSQAGLVNNLNDGMAWGLFPLWFERSGLSVAAIGLIVALYPGVWGVGQLATGALSDRVGRKPLIVAGMLLQAVAIAAIAATRTFGWWVAASSALGVGTAMVYPTLLAAIGDVAHPRWRASSIGVYRLWRDAGFAAGALFAGVIADLYGMAAAIWAVAALTAASGVIVALRMYETLPGYRPRSSSMMS